MPVYEYKALDNSGNLISGQEQGSSLASVASSLAMRGLSVEHLAIASGFGDPLGVPMPRPLSAEDSQVVEGRRQPPPAAPTVVPKEMKAPPTRPRNFVTRDIVAPVMGKIALHHISFFFRQLSVMLGAGVGMVDTLETLSGQTRSPKLARIIRELRDHANAGRPISAGMQRYPEVFTPLMMSLVRAGEQGGMLEATCAHIATYTDQEIEMRNLMKRETFYPKMVLVFSVILVIGVNLFVSQYLKSDLILLDSPLAHARTWYWLGPLLLGLFLFVRIGLHNGRIKLNWDAMLAYLPGFSGVVRKFAMAKFGRSFGVLYKGGVPMPDALRLSADACGNEYLRGRIHPAINKIKEGGGITDALRSTGAFNPIVLDMTGTGERTGNLDQMLERMSEFYEDEAVTQAQRNAKIISTVILCCVAVYVCIMIAQFFLNYMSAVMHYNDKD
jgi:type IV pilus assembly protein PilC/MSHA biogenesis protein MshG